MSTDEKLGVEEELLEPDVPLEEPLVLDPPEAALPDDLSEEPDELLPDAAGEDDEPLLEAAGADDELLPDAAGADGELLPDAAGADEDDELCATATLDSANSAAAVAALRTLSFNIGEPPLKVTGLAPFAMQVTCPSRLRPRSPRCGAASRAAPCAAAP